MCKQVPNQIFSAELLTTHGAVHSGGTLIISPSAETRFAKGVLAWWHHRVIEHFLTDGAEQVAGNLCRLQELSFSNLIRH